MDRNEKCKNWEQSEILWDMECFSLSWLGHHFPWTRQWSFGNTFFPQHQVCVELKLEQWRGCFSSFWMLQQHKSPARLSFSGFVWQKVRQWFEFFNFHLYYMSARYLNTNFYNSMYIYCRYLFHSSVHTPFFLQTIVIFFFPKLTNTKWAAGFSKVPWKYPSRTPMYTSSFWEQRDILEILQQRHPSYLAPMQLWE